MELPPLVEDDEWKRSGEQGGLEKAAAKPGFPEDVGDVKLATEHRVFD